MGMKVWKESVEEVIGTDKDGNPITVNVDVEYYEIICDYCGKLIVNSKTGEGLGSGYANVGDKYYHLDCYEIVKVKGEAGEE